MLIDIASLPRRSSITHWVTVVAASCVDLAITHQQTLTTVPGK
jgi:hypothetical protein